MARCTIPHGMRCKQSQAFREALRCEQSQAVRDIFTRHGRPARVARLCCVNASTASRWKSGKVPMPAMAVRLLEAIRRIECLEP